MTSATDVVTLAELARQVGWEPRRLLRQLERMDIELGGMLFARKPTKGHSALVRRAALRLFDVQFHSQVAKTVEERVTDLETRVNAIEARLSSAWIPPKY